MAKGKRSGCFGNRSQIEKKRFGRLWVLKTLEISVPRMGALHLCRCDLRFGGCGTFRLLSSAQLLSRGTKSCGCLQRQVVSERNKVQFEPVAVLEKGFKRRALTKGWKYTITLKQLRRLISLPCHYCDSPPAQLYPTKEMQFYYSALDRVDNEKGYETDNVVPCCKFCNRAKWAYPRQEFMEWINRVRNSKGSRRSP